MDVRYQSPRVPRNGSRVGPTCGDPDQKVSGMCDIGLGDVSICQGLESKRLRLDGVRGVK